MPAPCPYPRAVNQITLPMAAPAPARALVMGASVALTITWASLPADVVHPPPLFEQRLALGIILSAGWC